MEVPRSRQGWVRGKRTIEVTKRITSRRLHAAAKKSSECCSKGDAVCCSERNTMALRVPYVSCWMLPCCTVTSTPTRRKRRPQHQIPLWAAGFDEHRLHAFGERATALAAFGSMPRPGFLPLGWVPAAPPDPSGHVTAGRYSPRDLRSSRRGSEALCLRSRYNLQAEKESTVSL